MLTGYDYVSVIGDGCDNTRGSAPGILWSQINWILEVAKTDLF